MKAAALVAWNLRRLRVVRSLPQEILAADSEIDRSYVSRLERGIENPTIAVLEKLAAALGVHISEFLKEPTADAERPQPLRGGRKRKDLARK
jgi:transcriptional regulator with XRE-family HTH domain